MLPRTYLYALLSGLCFGVGWLYPGTLLCAVLGWAAVLSFTALLHQPDRRYRSAYLSGLIANAIGFYFLVGTIRDFGGYSSFFALCIFALFMAGSAVQYLLAVFVYNNLPAWLGRIGAAAAAAWVIGEFLSIRIFPWHAGHMQLALLPLVQIADLGGSLLVSFLVFWIAESALCALERPRLSLAAAPLAVLLSLGYGYLRLGQLRSEAEPQEIAVVQANISTAEKHNVRYFLRNTERYLELSRTAAAAPHAGTLLIIWPESVILDWIYDRIGRVEGDPRLPYLGDKAAWLVGAMTFADRSHFFNSAVAIYPDGTVPPPYHKRILMPFGEYIPFADVFPWLKQFNPLAADSFTAGTDTTVFDFPLRSPSGVERVVKVSPLICYEDVVQSLSREAARAGAELLVNLTNDAWFGDTATPRQHHLIAAFRAIENRRYLVRSTNTGLTAVVAASGETIAQLPVFSEDILYTKVSPRSELTLYTRLGDIPYWLLAALAAAAILHKRLAGRRRAG